MNDGDDQAARDARAKAIRDAVAEEIGSDAESQADGSPTDAIEPEHARSARELTDAAAAKARQRSGSPAP